jgi:hypothetical protein
MLAYSGSIPLVGFPENDKCGITIRLRSTRFANLGSIETMIDMPISAFW